jgi:DNA-binding IclR family transcriptional regulator
MKLNKREVSILDFLLRGSATITQISFALNLKKSNLSVYIKKLDAYKLIEIKKQARTQVISIHPLVSSEFISARANHLFLNLTDILVGYTPFLLSFLKNKRTFTLSDLDLPPATCKRLLKKIRSLGLIYMKKRGEYEIKNDSVSIANFCANLLISIQTHTFSKERATTVVATRSSTESAKKIEMIYVIEKQMKSKRYKPTSFSVFDKYGLHLISAGKFYYTNINPNIVDVIIHTLALSKDTRNIAYVCALMLKNAVDPKRILTKKQHFGLDKKFICDIIRFMQTNGQDAPIGFPSWQEVDSVLNG